MSNCSAVPELFRAIPRNSSDTPDHTVPVFPLFRGEHGTVGTVRILEWFAL
jgi:hypothetical protein